MGTTSFKTIYAWKIVDLEKPFFGWINLCNGTMFRIAMFDLLFSEPTSGLVGIYLSIERGGSFHFLDGGKGKYPLYVGEKLGLHPESSDTKNLTDFINDQLDIYDAPRFGDYYDEYLKNNPPYGLLGEIPMRPLVPLKFEKKEEA